MERAMEIAGNLDNVVDILEVGTSLIKDYGLNGSVSKVRKHFPDMVILADLKTCDEGGYEFRRAFEAGADYATVMGWSADETIEACMKEAREAGKHCFIDLLEVNKTRAAQLAARYPDAVIGIHLPADQEGAGLTELAGDMCRNLAGLCEIAAAGGVKLEDLKELQRLGVGIAVIGGAITKAEDIRSAAEAFVNEAHKEDENVTVQWSGKRRSLSDRRKRVMEHPEQQGC